jgi:hypothetical protein
MEEFALHLIMLHLTIDHPRISGAGPVLNMPGLLMLNANYGTLHIHRYDSKDSDLNSAQLLLLI